MKNEAKRIIEIGSNTQKSLGDIETRCPSDSNERPSDDADEKK